MELVRQIFSVCLVFGLLAGALWWMRRAGNLRLTDWNKRGKRRRSLESLERLNLTPHHSIHLVRIGEQTIVVAVHSSGCSVLGRLPAGNPPVKFQGVGA